MQFSDTTNKLGLVEDVDFLCDTDSTSYPTADKTRHINHWYHLTSVKIWRASGTWEFDDSNKTDLPIATTTMVASQNDYALPSTALKVLGVEVKDSGGNWARIKPIDNSELRSTITDFEKNDGLPQYYDIIGNSIFLYPAPTSTDTTLTNGLKIYLARTVDNFAASDTTKTPGFAEDFHRLLSYGAAYDFLLKRDTQKADRIRQEMTMMDNELLAYYGARHTDNRVRIKPRRESYN